MYAKFGIYSAFGVYKMIPRELITIDSRLTIAQADVAGTTLAIEETLEMPHPLTYISIDNEVIFVFL